MADLYQEIILEEYQHPRNKGVLLTPMITVKGVNASCGDKLEIFLNLDENDRVIALKWQGQGCAISTATTSLLTEHVLTQKLSLAEIQDLTREDLLSWLDLEKMSYGREKCLLLGLRTLKEAAEQRLKIEKKTKKGVAA